MAKNSTSLTCTKRARADCYTSTSGHRPDLGWCLQAKGFDPVFGARPVKRAVQRELETTLAKSLLKGEFGEGDTIAVSAPGGAQAEHLQVKRTHGNGSLNGSVTGSVDGALPLEVVA